MRIIDIVSEYLKANGYDGLFDGDGDCGCELADLMPCGELLANCEAGYKVPCDCDLHCDWHIAAKKQPMPPKE